MGQKVENWLPVRPRGCGSESLTKQELKISPRIRADLFEAGGHKLNRQQRRLRARNKTSAAI
jgi:hypothetical protein